MTPFPGRSLLFLGACLAAAPLSAQPMRIDVGPGQVPANGPSVLPVVGFDGRYTAFVSMASNLAAGDDNGHADLFRYDRHTGQLARGPLAPALGAGEYPQLVAISHDGRWLLFNDGRADWVSGDTNEAMDAFLYDFTTGAVERISVGSGGGQGNGHSYATSMTPDARWVAFHSEATNLVVPALSDVWSDVFVRDRHDGTTAQLSRGHDGGSANGSSLAPQLSPDGEWVAFASYATNLDVSTPAGAVTWRAFVAPRRGGIPDRVADATVAGGDVVNVGGLAWNAGSAALAWFVPGTGWHLGVWDRLGRATRAFPDPVDSLSPVGFTPPRLSLHGRYVAYGRSERSGAGVVVRVVRHHDLRSGQSRVLASDVQGPVEMSLDGSVVVYSDQSFAILLAQTMLPPDGRWPWGDADGDGLPNWWEEQGGLSAETASGDDGPAGDPDHDGATNLVELAAGTHPKGLHTRYLAEGVQNAFFDTRLALLNPGAAPAAALIRMLRDDATMASEAISVPPHTRRTVRADALASLRGHSFSIAVDSDVPLVVDRTTLWDGTAYGGHTEGAVSGASTTWYFAEGSTAGRFDLFYLLENPNPAVADATVTWLQPPPMAPVVHTYALPPMSRTTIYVDQADVRLASADVAAVIESTQPLFAERAMYWSRPGEPFAAGHGASGVTAPATRWHLAEGATGSFFETFILLLNPSGTPAECTVRYLLTSGSVLFKTYRLPPESRTTIWADVETFAGLGQALANASFATDVTVDNGVPIVVERAMWWPDGDWREAHASAAVTAPASRWAFADGDNVDALTYVLLANTSLDAADVRVTLVFEDGSTAQTVVPVGAQRRVTIDTRAMFPASAGRRFGAVVETSGTVPPALVVERVTYWNAEGVFWGGGTGAMASPLPF
jgi:hypothetical protein